MASQETQTFPLFSKLPTLLRHKIWTYNLPGPRHIPLVRSRDVIESAVGRAKDPVTLKVNQEARFVARLHFSARKLYTISSVFGDKIGNKYCWQYVDWENDIFELLWCSDNGGKLPYLAQEAGAIDDLNKIRRIVYTGDTRNSLSGFSQLKYFLDIGFESLKEVNVVLHRGVDYGRGEAKDDSMNRGKREWVQTQGNVLKKELEAMLRNAGAQQKLLKDFLLILRQCEKNCEICGRMEYYHLESSIRWDWDQILDYNPLLENGSRADIREIAAAQEAEGEVVRMAGESAYLKAALAESYDGITLKLDLDRQTNHSDSSKPVALQKEAATPAHIPALQKPNTQTSTKPEVSTMQPPSCSTATSDGLFRRFSDLPTELRLKIWTFAVPHPRYIDLTPSSSNDLTPSIVAFPENLMANMEARLIVSKYFPPLTRRSYRRELKMPYDYANDIFCISSLSWVLRERRDSPEYSWIPSVLENITRITPSLCSKHRYYIRHAPFTFDPTLEETVITGALPNLKEVVILRHGAWFRIDRNKRDSQPVLHQRPNQVPQLVPKLMTEFQKIGERVVEKGQRWDLTLTVTHCDNCPRCRKFAKRYIVDRGTRAARRQSAKERVARKREMVRTFGDVAESNRVCDPSSSPTTFPIHLG